MANHFPLAPEGYRVDEVDRFVAQVYDRMQAAIERFQQLEAELDALRRQNAALNQAAATASRMSESMVTEARKQAVEIVERARAESREQVIVARAEARALVADERRKVAHELELLAAAREMVVAERDSLLSFHSDLRDRLSSVVDSIARFNSKSDGFEAVLAIGSVVGVGEDVNGTGGADGVDERVAPRPGEGAEGEGNRRRAGSDATIGPRRDPALDHAFATFFSDEVDLEPSRAWILGGQ